MTKTGSITGYRIDYKMSKMGQGFSNTNSTYSAKVDPKGDGGVKK